MPEEVSSYVLKEREVKLISPKYEPSTGEFLGLYETIGFIIVRGDEDEHFLNYRIDDNNSKFSTLFIREEFLMPSEEQCLTDIK